MTLTRLAGLAIVLVSVGSCGAGGAAVVTWETPDGSRFATEITNESDLERIREAVEADGRAGIPNGRLVRGDGGVNIGHDWHMVEVELADMAIEVCDGTASMVDEDLDYWLETVGRYCPWGARVVAIDD